MLTLGLSRRRRCLSLCAVDHDCWIDRLPVRRDRLSILSPTELRPRRLLLDLLFDNSFTARPSFNIGLLTILSVLWLCESSFYAVDVF